MLDTQLQLTYKKLLEGIEENKQLLAMKCINCGTVTFPPKAVCMRCCSRDYQVIELCGKGVVKTFTIIRVPPEGFDGEYVVGLVELLEGPNIMVTIKTDHQPDMGIIGKRGTLGYFLMTGDKYSGGRRASFLFYLDE